MVGLIAGAILNGAADPVGDAWRQRWAAEAPERQR
eukprot:COSAG04_NODE_15373_length_534_cov_0.685057_1_plen_34_part_10